MNLPDTWKKHAKIRYGTVASGIKSINVECDMRHTNSCINEMIVGKRNISACVHNKMLADVIVDALDGFEFKNGDVLDLYKKFRLPSRQE